MTGRPLVVVEGSPSATATRARQAVQLAAEAGWIVSEGWVAPLSRERVICHGAIRDTDDARRALLAAVAGAGLVVEAFAGREAIDRFLDDLRRIGPVQHVTADQVAAPSVRIRHDERALLALLGEGLTLGEAAAELGLARRTADRRLAAARRALGVSTTAEAILAAARRPA